LLPPTAAMAQGGVDEVKQVITEFLIPFSSRDMDGFMRYFADDATVFFPPSAKGAAPERVQGKTAIAKEFAASPGTS
jgi:ketosteroid isomerase-like protein